MSNVDKAKITRRNYLKYAGGIVAAAVVGAAGYGIYQSTQPPPTPPTTTTTTAVATTAAAPRTLRVANWRVGSYGEDVIAKVDKPFEEMFNCKIEVDTAFPWGPKLKAASVDNPPYDVVQDATNSAMKLGDEGFYVSADEMTANIPNVKNLWDFAFVGGANWGGVMNFYLRQGLAYSPDKVKKPPTSWRDLWDNAYAGKRASFVLTNNLGVNMMMMANKLFGKDQYDIDAGLAAFEKLKPLKLSNFTLEMLQLFERGEVVIGPNAADNVWFMRDFQGANFVDYSAPTEGELVAPGCLSITKGSKVKDLAYEYVNWWLDPQGGQKMLAEGEWGGLVTNNVDAGAYKKHGITNSPEEVKKLISFDYNWWNAHEEEILERFNKIM